jgi:hypothetical protein
MKMVAHLYHFLVSDPLNWARSPVWLMSFGQLRQYPPAWWQQKLCEDISTLCRAKEALSLCQRGSRRT